MPFLTIAACTIEPRVQIVELSYGNRNSLILVWKCFWQSWNCERSIPSSDKYSNFCDLNWRILIKRPFGFNRIVLHPTVQMSLLIDLDRNFLDETSRNNYVNWPTRSCDLSSLDCFIWGYLISQIHCNNLQSIYELKDKIIRLISERESQFKISLKAQNSWRLYSWK